MMWARRRKQNRVREAAQPLQWQKPTRWLLMLVLLVIGMQQTWQLIERQGFETFRALEVSGELANVRAEEVHAVLKEQIAAGFVNFDIAVARASVEAMPWVKSASIRRGWPGVLHVEIVEQQPVATWFGTALMNAEGEVFLDGAAGVSGELVDIGGPQDSQRRLLARVAELKDMLRPLQLDLQRIVLSERRAERLWLANGIEVRLGRRDHEKRLKRFIDSAWPELQQQESDIAYVDMRYTNGFAVGWKTSDQG